MSSEKEGKVICWSVCVLCTIFTVVDDGDSVGRRLFHKGGLTVWTVTNVDKEGETVRGGDMKAEIRLLCHRLMH